MYGLCGSYIFASLILRHPFYGTNCGMKLRSDSSDSGFPCVLCSTSDETHPGLKMSDESDQKYNRRNTLELSLGKGSRRGGGGEMKIGGFVPLHKDKIPPLSPLPILSQETR
jgi:hypothetical protein